MGALKFILTTSFLFIVITVTWAQEQDCLSKLDGAETLFNTGLFEEIPALLEDCMELYSETDRKKAYRLIILAYYMNDDVTAAEESMYYFLKEFPDFKPAAIDLVEFQYIFNKLLFMLLNNTFLSSNFHHGKQFLFAHSPNWVFSFKELH